MASNVYVPTSVDPSNTILQGTAFDGPRARLCGRQNLIPSSRFEISIGNWLASDVTILRTFDPTNIFGRYVLDVEDSSATATGYAISASNDPGEDLYLKTLLLVCWVKAVNADTTLDFRIRNADFSASHDTGSISLTKDQWTFVHWTVSLSDTDWSGITQFYLDTHPALGAASNTGRVYYMLPRVYRVFETLNSLPKLPLVELDFRPWLKTEPNRNTFGQLEISKRAFIPIARLAHPTASKTQMDDIGAIYHHDGIVLFEPEESSSVAFLMNTVREQWRYRYLAKRAIGYHGKLMLEGMEPIFGIPEANLYFEEEDKFYVAIPRYVRAT